MSGLLQPKLIWAGIALAALSIAIVFFGLLSIMIVQDREAAWYPGSEKITNHDVIRIFPNFFYRQDSSYKSQDDFTSVFNWYSGGFHLGPEKTAQGGCSLMYNTEDIYFIQRVISVTVCNTTSGRMVFVQRTLSLNLR
jgi:hypothetical protein